MGLEDRTYWREESSDRIGPPTSWSIITWLILINAAVFVVDLFTAKTSGGRWLSDNLGVETATLMRPWEWWKFLTYGFAHDPSDLWHIFGNMLILGFLGRIVVDRLGSREFLRVYLATVVFAGVVWCIVQNVLGVDTAAYGASGGAAGVVALLALYFPNLPLRVYFVVPVPAWVVGLIMLAMEMLSALNNDSHIAHSAHLAGVAFAVLYWKFNWNLGKLMPQRLSWPTKGRSLVSGKPKLRVFQPKDDATMEQEVDRILAKINEQGEAALTSKERRTLNEASQRYRERQR